MKQIKNNSLKTFAVWTLIWLHFFHNVALTKHKKKTIYSQVKVSRDKMHILGYQLSVQTLKLSSFKANRGRPVKAMQDQ